MDQVVVHRGRTVTLPVSLGIDVSSDEFESQIREEADFESDLIAEWTISFLTDGTDGELILVLDDSITSAIEKTVGYMDLKRITGGEPVPVFDAPLEVIFKNSVTA